MKKRSRIVMMPALFVWALFSTLLFSAASAHAGKQDFVLVNNTGRDIREVYVSSTKSNNWEENILGRDKVANKKSVTITFDDRKYKKVKKWDLKIVDVKGRSAEWNNLDLRKTSKLTLYFNKKGEPIADVE